MSGGLNKKVLIPVVGVFLLLAVTALVVTIINGGDSDAGSAVATGESEVDVRPGTTLSSGQRLINPDATAPSTESLDETGDPEVEGQPDSQTTEGSGSAQTGVGFADNYNDHLNFLLNSEARVQTIERAGTSFGSAVNPALTVNIQNNDRRSVPSAQLNINDVIAGQGAADAGKPRGGGVFHIQCTFSHFAYDDPILFPNQPGAGHLHMFFGNTEANAYSTYDSLLNTGNSTCQHQELNRTAYWSPALLDGDGNAIVPTEFLIYYERFGPTDANRIETLPEGLNFIVDSDDPRVGGPGSPIGQQGLTFNCGQGDQNVPQNGPAGPNVPYIPDCDKNVYHSMQMDLEAPTCWNGELDWDPDNPNVVYPTAIYSAACPASHPQVLPQLIYRFRFDLSTSPTPTNTWYLSSDVDPNTGELVGRPGATLHTDWFGGWNRDTITRLINDCLRPSGKWCDPMHMGNGDLVPLLASDRNYQHSLLYTPEQYLTACPFRDAPTGNRADLAYCAPGDHSSHGG